MKSSAGTRQVHRDLSVNSCVTPSDLDASPSWYAMVGHQRIWVGLVVSLLMALLHTAPVAAQAGTTFRVYPQLLRDVPPAGIAAAASESRMGGTQQIIIDTDPGVDDVAALAWAFLQTDYDVEILGIVATAGNTSIENATRNALIVRNLAGASHVPVYMGERRPLAQQLSSTGLLVHGIDGLWSAGGSFSTNLNQAQRQAWRFYCQTARTHPGATIVALGPLTNIARALRSCGSDMQSYAHIVVLGGAQVGGNSTPVAEFNIWQDPEAADLVFTSGINITLVPLDTFTSLQFTIADLFPLAASGNPVAGLLTCVLGVCPPGFAQLPPQIAGGIVGLSPLGIYLMTQEQAVGEASVPDVAAMMFALDNSLGDTTSALAKVMLRPDLVRGQTIIGLNPSSKVPMIISDRELSRLAEAAYDDPLTFPDLPGLVLPNQDVLLQGIGAALASEPDNVEIVISIEADVMRGMFGAALTAPPSQASISAFSAERTLPDTLAPPLPQLFVPVVDAAD